MNICKRYLWVLFVILCINVAGQSSNPSHLSYDTVVLGIESRESKLRDFEVTYMVTLPDHEGHVLEESTWRYKNGKEYRSTDKKFPNGEELDQIFCWNGEKLLTFNRQRKQGSIRNPVGDEFFSQADPLSLFGYRIGSRKRRGESLATHLRSALSGKKAYPSSDEENTPVYIIEAEVILDDEEYPQKTLLKAYIDTKRDFIPLKIELHAVRPDEQISLFKRLGVEASSGLYRRIEVTEWTKDSQTGSWFPKSGRDTYFTADVVLKDGVELKDIQGLSNEDMAKQIVRIDRIPLGFGTWEYRMLDFAANQGVSDESFTIKYPPGTLIYDEFIDCAYKIAGEKVLGNFENDMKIYTEHTSVSMKEGGSRAKSIIRENQIDDEKNVNNNPIPQNKWGVFASILTILSGIIVILVIIIVIINKGKERSVL